MVVEGVYKIDITKQINDRNAAEIVKFIQGGLNNRKMRDTEQNETSSRSHLILTVEASMLTRMWGEIYNKYLMIDLAGNERASRISVLPKRYLELLFINESLEILRSTIKDVSSGNSDINFTINPLTHLLGDTLNAPYLGAFNAGRTQVIVCVNPSQKDVQDTLETMEFA